MGKNDFDSVVERLIFWFVLVWFPSYGNSEGLYGKGKRHDTPVDPGSLIESNNISHKVHHVVSRYSIL